MNIKKLTILVAAALLSTAVSAQQIQLTFEGVVNNNSEDSFTLVIEYSSDEPDLNPDPNVGAYDNMSMVLTHGAETLSINNAGLNVDVIEPDPSIEGLELGLEGIQWVIRFEQWSGTLLGQAVVPGPGNTINFGRQYQGTLSDALPLTVDLDDWEYSNGCFHLASGDLACVDLLTQVFSDPDDNSLRRSRERRASPSWPWARCCIPRCSRRGIRIGSRSD